MGNCLVTKLKSVVNNDDLTKLGQISLGLIGIPQTYEKDFVGVQLTANGNETIGYPSVNGVIKNYNNDTVIPEINTVGNSMFRVTSAGTAVKNLVWINPKYNLTRLIFGTYIVCDLSLLSKNNLINLGAISGYYNISGYGKLSTILESSKATINRLCIRGTGVTGTLEDLYECTALTELNTDISGDWHLFVEGQKANGRTSGDISFTKDLFGTFNGTALAVFEQYGSNGHIVWNGSKSYIICNFGNKVYCMGYTDEEIATNTASGGIWENKTAIKCD